MNKFAVSLVVVVACVGLASATWTDWGKSKDKEVDKDKDKDDYKGHNHLACGGYRCDGPYEHGHYGHEGYGNKGYGHGGYGNKYGHEGYGHQGHYGHEGYGHHGHPHGHHGGKHMDKHFGIGFDQSFSKGRGLSGVAGVGAGVRSEHELDAGVHHGTRLGSHKSIEGKKAFGAGHKKQFGASVQHHDSHDNEGHHKTRVHNKNKLIVAEKDQGFEDDKGFRHHHDHSDQAQIGASDSKFVGGKAGGKIVSDHGLEHESGAGIHGESEHEAGIGAGVHGHHNSARAIGAGAGIGAGLRNENEFDAGVGQSTRLGSKNSIGAGAGFGAGSKKGFGAGVQHAKSNSNEGHHRKSAHNNNKLIVAEKNTGFDDDKGFHTHSSELDQAHIGAEDGNFIGAGLGGKISSDHGLEHESGAGIHGSNDFGAGVGKGVGAGFNF